MFRGNQKFTTANIAVATALMFGSAGAFAQEAASAPTVVAPPPVVQTAPAPTPAPVATPTVAPPPAVPTISAEPVQAEQPAPRRTSAPRATAQPSPRVRAVPAASAAAPAAQIEAIEPTAINAPVNEETFAAAATVEDTAPIAPADQSSATQITDGADDDWMVYGGIAAALGLAGLGGALAARRRRTRSRDDVALEPTRAATAPVRDLPRAAVPTPAASVAPMATPVAAPIRRPSFADRHLPPVTDPLFMHQAELGPITDPLFMQKTELGPITDPLFADKNEYVGQSAAGSAFDKRRDWLPPSNDERKPLHEFEPAE